MRKILALAFIVLACSFACSVTDSSDAAATDLLLFEVNPYHADEGISIHNYGSSPIDLRDYCVTDNPSKESSEGIMTFDQSIVLSPGDTVTFIKKPAEDTGFAYRYTTYISGDGYVTFSGRFTLNDSGDDVYLFRGDNVVDTFVYGKTEPLAGGLWTSEAFSIKSGCFAERRTSDGFDSTCWFSFLPGNTNIPFDPDLRFSASVTPFLFPESGGIPIYDALENAQRSVYITLYTLSSGNIIGLLQQLLSRGVEVNLLLEAAPLDTSKPVTDGRLKTLSESGANILLIGGVSGDRFDYVHAKYCIIDGYKVIITSENWTHKNMNGVTVTDPVLGEGNRGWGAIVESAEYAGFMLNVFQNDADMSYGDVVRFEDAAVGLKPVELSYTAPADTYPVRTYRTEITPGLSPDSSYDAELFYISGACGRIYSEQQSLTLTYLDYKVESPLKYLYQKASLGTDVRLIFGTNVKQYVVDEINATSQIKTAMMDGPYVHNKGLICDDVAIVASVNWTTTSFSNNRECLIAIHSSAIADYYAAAYEEDFDRNYRGSGLTVAFTEIEPHYGSAGEYAVAVEVKQTGSFTYSWDLDGKVKETGASRTVMQFDEGDHVLKVTVTGTDGSKGIAYHSFSVDGSSGDGDGILDRFGSYLAPIAVMVLAVIVAVLRAAAGGRR